MLQTLLLATGLLAPAPPALPAWAQTQWNQAGLSKSFRQHRYASPGTLQADFNGDGKPDVAVLVSRNATHSRGIIIFHQGQTGYHVLGTGAASSQGILKGDFQWVKYWGLYTKPTTWEMLFDPNGDLADSRTVRLKHPTIEITAEEQGGGMIYWTGKRYIWIHQTC